MNRTPLIMLRHAIQLSLALALLACGNPGTGATGPAPPIDAGSDTATPPLERDAAPAPVAQAPADAAPTGIDAADCQRFVNHAIGISLGVHNKNTPPELRPTAEQIATIRKQLGGELAAACAKLPKAGFQCAMAAKTKEAFLACGSPATPEAGPPSGKPPRPGHSSP